MAKKKQKKRLKKNKKKIENKTVAPSMTEKKATHSDLQPQVLSSDEYFKLSQAKTHWLFGEWNQLTVLQYHEVQKHPERDRLALLVASAHQQQDNHEDARQWGKRALAWGCPPRVAAKVFISAVHNTLGRIAALKQDDQKAHRHFMESISIIEPQNAELMAHTRSVRELAKLGLLPQAAAYIEEEQKVLQVYRPFKQQAVASMLRNELELLRHELSLAQQRYQLFNRGLAGKSTHFGGTKRWKKKLESKSASQLGQDLWVLEQMDYKRNGFFVDFGATDGVLLSNTWLLEKEFDWQGICAEPNPEFQKQLSNNRSCIISNQCIGGRTGEKVQFILAKEFGGIRDFAKVGKHKDKLIAYEQENHIVEFETISLHDLLLKHNAPEEIDYLSIDTEGSEYHILSEFPFDRWKIRCLTIEHNYEAQREKIYSLLRKKGYERTKCQWDDFYILKS